MDKETQIKELEKKKSLLEEQIGVLQDEVTVIENNIDNLKYSIDKDYTGKYLKITNESVGETMKLITVIQVQRQESSSFCCSVFGPGVRFTDFKDGDSQVEFHTNLSHSVFIFIPNSSQPIVEEITECEFMVTIEQSFYPRILKEIYAKEI